MINVYQVALPLILGKRVSASEVAASRFLGSATVIAGRVCTCKHVVESVDFTQDLVLTKWNLVGNWVVFGEALLHPRFDFAVLSSSERPPFPNLPLFDKELTMGTTLYATGYHYDGVTSGPEGLNISLAPRTFFGNVVRVYEVESNHSPSICELSFPTLSGFSGGALVAKDFSSILGMVYGNAEQSIRVHSRYEQRDNHVEYSETVNRILEFGLFHSAADVKRLAGDLGVA